MELNNALKGTLYGWGNTNAIKYVGTAVATDPVVRAATAPEQIWVTACKQDSLYCSDNNRDGSRRPVDNGWAQIGDKRQVFDISELKPSDQTNVITVSNNGILNPLDAALKNAVKQNNRQTTKEGVVVVYNRPTSNPLSEVLYAAYDKANDLLGGRLPLTTAEKTNIKLYEYAKQNGYQIDLSSHSRGGLTSSVALQHANRNGLTEIPIRQSRFYGTATNVQSYANQLNRNGYMDKDGAYSAVHKSDFVGNKWGLGLLGNNAPTGGAFLFCYSHSGYSAEVPNEYLINERGQYINDKGYTVTGENKIKNPYYKEFKEKWHPTVDNPNPSLPKLVKPK